MAKSPPEKKRQQARPAQPQLPPECRRRARAADATFERTVGQALPGRGDEPAGRR